jgi:murein DD-endopeptidase MepM/ murein hydrolase activator NlpD
MEKDKNKLPNMTNKFIPRPDNVKHFIPDMDNENDYWDFFFSKIRNLFPLKFPVLNGENLIDKFTGNYGYRWHPVKQQPNYFHAGIDININAGTEVFAVAEGIFEYSGFHPVNGTYILLSHPQICTEDGFTLFSSYLHLSKYMVKFSIIHKIFRELGFRKITNKRIRKGQLIGLSGDTGNSVDVYPHLHLQLEFRKEEKIIIINPCELFGIKSFNNITAEIKRKEDFKNLIIENDELKKWTKFL